MYRARKLSTLSELCFIPTDTLALADATIDEAVLFRRQPRAVVIFRQLPAAHDTALHVVSD
jgi:hypothetical protein